MDERLIELGRMWVEKYLYSSELFHHGVKGQKWGVRNGPPYPLDKRASDDIPVEKTGNGGIIEEAIKSGTVKKQINPESQERHNFSTHEEGRSYLCGDTAFAQRLVDELSGTGEALLDSKGQWLHKERVMANEIIGMHVDAQGKETATKAAMIVYSKTGTHIYPRKEED